MIYGDVCTGISAASVAWSPLGWRPAFFSEIEPFPCRLLKHHYPDVPNLGDITKLLENKTFLDANINVLVGGTPCQSFSLAGLRGGLADDRGNLALEYCRLLIAKRPQWFVWENVPGVFSSWSDDPESKVPADGSGGYDCSQTSDFATLLAAFRECGYSCCWRVLDSQFFGVPQRRRRVFVVGYFGDDWRPPAAVLFEPQSVRGHTSPIEKKRQEIAGTINASAGRSRGAGTDPGTITQQKIVGTLSADNNSRCGITEVDAGVFIPVNLPDKAGALDTQCGGEKLTGQSAAMGHLLAGSWWDGGQVSQTLDAVLHKSQTMPEKNRFPAVLVPTDQPAGPGVIGFDSAMVSNPNNRSNLDNIQPTIKTDGKGAIAHPAMMVRRLTPTECERLQGFPDNYTAIPGAADGPRYKAIGNSMTTLVMRWIGSRIDKVDKVLNIKK